MVLIPFEIDSSLAHPGVRIENGVATKETNGGWVTLRATRSLSPGNHQWAVKILDQGEGADGSGFMLGLLTSFVGSSASVNCGTKYISELGGWCFSRAGQTYGNWKCEKITFSSGSVVEFDADFATGTLTITSGREKAIGQIPSLRDTEVFPAFSLYYLNQKVTFV
eukprot:NODE_5951_length_621_cov_59.980769_g5549_i0.p1 GENE.NODE_5951_length_621_cov_59.980769_g5549_i0~~NODE_5951_length_621_cov_59.980769_g5549_i0.p1  ORF type:complete len:166 (+),score=26.08 NODE_5951_length_621_cov_59.980769_g5549_i0:100-597(+)